MKKSLLTLLVVAVMAQAFFTATAEPVGLSKAESIAYQFVSSGKAMFKAGAGNTLRLAHEAKSVDGLTDYYVFNRGDGGGFVVVSGDDRLQPIPGYSESGSFDADALPENVQWWFSEYQRQMQFLRDNPKVKARKKVELDNVVAPLLTTKWSQGRPYNDMCPVAPSNNDPYLYYGGRAATGCVATAMTQVMNYWQWPKRGQGSHGYDCDVNYYNSEAGVNDYRTEHLSVDFSQSVYQWDLMMDEYMYIYDPNESVIMIKDKNGRLHIDYDGAYSNAVAKLMSDAGVSVDMGYGADGSGADSYKVYTALYNYFGYLVLYDSRDDFPDDMWDESMRIALDAGRPIYYSGSGQNGGHAFVLDGYDNEERFHVNWGWGGSCDGYYESLSLNPEHYSFNSSQSKVTCWPYKPFTSLPENGKTIDFGTIPMDSASVRTIMLYGTYLDDRVMVNISGADAWNFQTEVYAIQPAELNGEEGYALEIVYFPPEQGSHTAQLTLTPQGKDLHGNPIEPICFTLKGRLGDVYDVNLDGEVNLADVNAALGLVLTGAADSLVGDVNTDGEITIADVNALIDFVLGQ